LFQNSQTGDYALAFRGTDQFLSDVDDDIEILLGWVPDQYNKAKEALNTAATIYPNSLRKMYVTGHSLGGGLAALVSAKAPKPMPTVTFNAPGMMRSYIGSHFFSTIGVVNYVKMDASKFLHVRIKGDIVSIGTGPKIGNNNVKTVANAYCEANNPGLAERAVNVLRGPLGRVDNLKKDADYVLCTHSMEKTLHVISGIPEFNKPLGWV